MNKSPPEEVPRYTEDRSLVILGIKEHFGYSEISSLVYGSGPPTRLEIRTVNRTFVSIQGTEDNLIEVTINRTNPLSRSKLLIELYEFK